VLTDVLVPHNRWDLLASHRAPRPRVSVIVAHYEQPAKLARTIDALNRQTLVPEQIVVADDGSETTPRVSSSVPVSVVAQPDHGFRAAAARNLGARHATGEVLVFLDADTVPEPGFLAALTRHVAVCPDVLAVGRRRHADLSALPTGGDPAAAPRLPEPEWLRAGYAASRDLLDADGRSFRFVISAVLGCRRELFDDLDGFDERFVGYGGEDWDLGYRAWNAGAVLVHERDAVAWHDGPDWAGRTEDRARKDVESARLAALIPEPRTRGAPLPGTLPDVLVDVPSGLAAADLVRTVHSLLRQDHRDLRVRLPTPVDPDVARLYEGVAGCKEWSPDQRRRARAHVRVTAPLPPTAIGSAVRALVDDDLGTVVLRGSDRVLAVVTSVRAVGRARRWAARTPRDDVVADAFGSATLDVGDGPAPGRDLAGFFASGPDGPRRRG
jgi:hypothetical protein